MKGNSREWLLSGNYPPKKFLEEIISDSCDNKYVLK
jgi:hypothetical protein